MAALDAFFPDVLVEVPGCPLPMVKHHVRRSIIEFCERTRRLTYTCPSINSVADTSTYSIAPPADHEVHEIISVRHNNIPVNPVGEDWLNANLSNWQSKKSKTATGYMFTRPVTVRLYPIPSEAGTGNISVMVALKPTQVAVVIDDRLLAYSEVIAAGAKRRLMVMPKKEWSDANLAIYYGGIFNAGIGKARIDSIVSDSAFSGEIMRRNF